ncbi:MAG: HlyD family efflux transporter periplasmic adaptor subunit [Planctomycetes bacterium]|nr:HlyD family efflux transporter periplasmic adaptor subunit [Planctomycetota bacterium]
MNNVDLSKLRIEDAATAMPKRPVGARLLVLGVVLLGLGVAATFVWPLLRPERAVPMARVRAAGQATAASQAAAEAVGWVEPDPFPQFVLPLVDGRVGAIEVLEGAAVVADQTVLARLDNAALLAAKDRAVVAVAEREAALRAADVAAAAAARARQQNIERQSALAEARLAAAEQQRAVATANGDLQRAEAEERGARAALQAQQELAAAGGSNTIAVARAAAAVDAAMAVVAAARGSVDAVAKAAAAASQLQELAAIWAQDPAELQGAADVAAAAVATARAALATARAELAIAERELGWCTVKAPGNGVVLKLLAAPGGVVGPDRGPLLSLYDPARLRARIDVPLASVAAVAVGQDVELRSEVTGNLVVHGTVQRVQHESDLLKNTLQVKVGIAAPPPLWRPETLVRARFLGGGAPGAEAHAVVATFLLPKVALRDGVVFVFDPAARAARAVPVEKVGDSGDDVVVRGELSVAQRVVTVPVQPGERVRPEDGR